MTPEERKETRAMPERILVDALMIVHFYAGARAMQNPIEYVRADVAEAENARLRAALEKIVGSNCFCKITEQGPDYRHSAICAWARAALRQDERGPWKEGGGG